MARTADIWPAEKLEELTFIQRKVLDYIVETIETDGYFPSCEEIKKVINSRARMTAHQHLTALMAKGFLGHRGRHFTIGAKLLILAVL